MNLSVLGAGELGVACALSLLANKPSHHVSLLSRDVNASTTVSSSGELSFRAHTQRSVRVQPKLRVESYHTAAQARLSHAVFMCTPSDALAPSGPLPEQLVKASDETPAQAAAMPVFPYLRAWRDQLPSSTEPPPFLAVFTRGLSAEGFAPVDLVCHELGLGGASEEGRGDRRAPLILSATGPIFAREWGAQSSLPAPAAQETATKGDGDPKAPSDDPAQAPCKPFSGTALVFALNSPDPDPGLVLALRKHLQENLFHRESVTLLDGAHSGGLVKLINACLPLCAFGAGLVSNCYAGSNASALAAYAQHALSATEVLINQLLGRPAHTPLPTCLYATLFSACTNYGLREFVLGRQFDFHFKKAFALQAVYSGKSHTTFSATVNGLHTLMKDRSVSSPFYEIILDTFTTFLRASVVGAGLVKEGYYDYRQPSPRPLLEYAMEVDKAAFSGNEDAFEAAKARFMDVLSQDPK